MKTALRAQGFEGKRVVVERFLNMRWEGTDTALMALGSQLRGDETGPSEEDFEEAFRKAYKHEFGFLLENKRIIVDDIKASTSYLVVDSTDEETSGPGYWQNVRFTGAKCL